ncbi:MAG: hypothetical protein JSU94_14730 [Phycisphaerales bacterium]|nr:MAG: hypothetical protein JSU94_14730 [Phycisphaerales bacterium]
MAHPDLDELLNALYGAAREMLAKHGEFFPFGACTDVNGEVALVGGHTGDERPPSQEVIDVITAGLKDRAGKGEIKAAGICFDASVIPPGESRKVDAICARLEHSNGESALVFLPYRKSWFGRTKYGRLFAKQGGHDIFVGGSA